MLLSWFETCYPECTKRGVASGHCTCKWAILWWLDVELRRALIPFGWFDARRSFDISTSFMKEDTRHCWPSNSAIVLLYSLVFFLSSIINFNWVYYSPASGSSVAEAQLFDFNFDEFKRRWNDYVNLACRVSFYF